MAPFYTHLTVLNDSATRHPTATAFRIPVVDSSATVPSRWHSISYRQFRDDVDHFAKYWYETFTAQDIPPRSVIGVWLSGMSYLDVLHIYGVARAGYIPQLISLRLPSPEVIWELLEQSKGRALIYDLSLATNLLGGPVPVHVAVDARGRDLSQIPLPEVAEEVRGDDTIMIFHTSGSTSGRPKLIPCSYAWWSTTIAKAQLLLEPKSFAKHKQDVTCLMGSLCHMGQSFMLVGTLLHGSCMIQCTRQDFSSDELQAMISSCGLNRMNIFPTYLSTHLRNSRRDPKLLAQLQSLDEILITGVSLSQEDLQWARGNNIRLLDCYATTEVAVMMLGSGDESGRPFVPLQPIEGGSYTFAPIAPPAEDGYKNPHAQLVELVVLGSSPDCPDVSLRHADGNYHTGDLFLEVLPGKFIFSGRDDDWIKTQNSLRCNTKAIEDNVYAVCRDLISNCVVVGNGRPSPALFVESSTNTDETALRKEIMRRIRPFHSRRYLHERILSADFIVVVPVKTLPRTATKGNIRRRAVEQTYQPALDRLYGSEQY